MKTLIVVRHAHRDKAPGRETDNGISPKGKKEARLLARFFERRFSEDFKPDEVTLVSSPKRRCVETLLPLAAGLGVEVQISPDLDEGEALGPRIRSFIESWSRIESPLTVICSHGDWIPVFFEKFLGVAIDLKKGAWAEVECEEPSRRLTWVVQELDVL